MNGVHNPGFESEVQSGVPDMHEALPSLPEQFGGGPGKTEIQTRMPSSFDNDHENRYYYCGWISYRPRYLQRFRTPKWVLFWLCWAATMQGLIVNGFINIVITTIERRFGFRSAQTGLIAGGYDIASFILLVPVSYLGGRSKASKPRYIGIGTLVLGLGSFVFASPHLLSGAYRAGIQVSHVCQRVENTTTRSTSCSGSTVEQAELESSSGMYLAIFLVAQLLHGAGAAPFYTLGVTYLDENVSRKMSSVYLGIYYTMSIIGPAVGYVVGGELLKVYTDFMTVDPASIGLTPYGNLWIGAWWVGFILAAIICWAIALPILAFPAILPGADEIAREKVSEAHSSNPRSGDSAAATPNQVFSKIQEIPKALAELLGNPAFFMLNLAGASEGLLIAGFAAFLPKYLENQFSVSASSVALLMGIITVPAGGGGTFLGGYLVKYWELSCSGILKLCLLTTAPCLIFNLAFFLSCSNLDFAGLTVQYNKSEINRSLSLNHACNYGCGCSTSDFFPVCGVNNIRYYSPCYAGCLHTKSLSGIETFSNCSCIEAPPKSVISPSNEKIFYEAQNTTCESDCIYLWMFIALTFCNMLLTFVCTMPALSATLRVVREDQRSFALGIQWIKVRILGTIPAPVIFGTLIDDTCILWQDTCDGSGACLVYDNYYVSRYMFILAAAAKTASVLFFFMAWWTYRPPNGQNENQINANNNSRQAPVATLVLNPPTTQNRGARGQTVRTIT